MHFIECSRDCVCFKIVNNKDHFGSVILLQNGLLQCVEDQLYVNNFLIQSICTCKHSYVLWINGLFLNYFITNLKRSLFYRKCVLNRFRNSQCTCTRTIVLNLQSPPQEIIDYGWNFRMQQLVWNHCEMDYKLSWLSTLGGAFSSLGDEFQNCALMAGQISLNQMKIAKRIGDPSIVGRCLLYLSLSYIQRGYLKTARMIISIIYDSTKGKLREDKRLRNMCLGIWTKLQYEHEKRRNGFSYK